MIINKQLKQLRCFEAASSVSDRVSVAQNWIPLPFHSLEMNFFGQCQANPSLRFHKRKISNQLPFQSGEEKKLFPTFEKFQDSWIYKFDFFVFFCFLVTDFERDFQSNSTRFFTVGFGGRIYLEFLSWISFSFGYLVLLLLLLWKCTWNGGSAAKR